MLYYLYLKDVSTGRFGEPQRADPHCRNIREPDFIRNGVNKDGDGIGTTGAAVKKSVKLFDHAHKTAECDVGGRQHRITVYVSVFRKVEKKSIELIPHLH